MLDAKIYTIGTAKFLSTNSKYLCISVGMNEYDYVIGGLYSFPSNHDWDTINHLDEISYHDLHNDAIDYFDDIFNVEDQLKSLFNI
jgi:hypothetical protein